MLSPWLLQGPSVTWKAVSGPGPLDPARLAAHSDRKQPLCSFISTLRAIMQTQTLSTVRVSAAVSMSLLEDTVPMQ